MKKAHGVLGSLLCLLVGCGSATMTAVRYDAEVNVTSSFPARIELRTGTVTGRPTSSTVYAGGIFIPMTVASNPEVQFGVADQITFVRSLADELRRHQILLPVEFETAESTIELVVHFLSTEHIPTFQQYRAHVQLEMNCGVLTEMRDYTVLSSEGDTTMQKMSTDAATGKGKAAGKLMNAMVPDVEKFVSAVKAKTPSDSGQSPMLGLCKH